MKKLSLILLLSISFLGVSQTPKTSNQVNHIAIDQYYSGINTYTDTLQFWTYELQDTTLRKFPPAHVSYANGLKTTYTFDSIAVGKSIKINDVVFSNREILKWMLGYQILAVHKDTILNYFRVNGEWKFKKIYRKAPLPLVIQKHSNLPQDFFMFKPYSLEAIRFKCFAEAKIFDMLAFPADTALVNPRFLIDGKLQSRGFTSDNLKMNEVKSIEVFSPQEAMRFFSYKFRKGIVSVTTKNSKSNEEAFNRNIRVLEEMQQKDGSWVAQSDTVLPNIESFRAYQKAKLTAQNAPIYLIDGELETESVNRKTYNMDRMESLITKLSPREYDRKLNKFIQTATDTVKITSYQGRAFGDRLSNLPGIFHDLQQLRKTQPDPNPIYIVDDKEIDFEKLKNLSMKNLEMVAVLEGCDAIQKYGKRGENGVVIYKSK